MQKIKTWSDLNKALKQVALPIIIDNIADRVKATLRMNLNTMWYRTHTPSSYQRTYDLLNAIDISVKQSGSSYVATVFFNSELMGAHPSWVDDMDMKDWIAYWIEYGTSGSPIFNFPAVKFTEQTYKEANKIIQNSIRDLRKHGIILKLL